MNNLNPSEPSQSEQVPTKQSPAWLKALEAQSWQAELIISGLVAAGLLRLPDWLLAWGEQYIISSSELGSTFLFMAFLFALCGANVLLVCFAIHFIFRSIWIALLGLNSVFPEGINVKSTAGAGPTYWKKAKEMFPDLSAYNEELDKNCSLIFSLAACTAIMMVSFSIIVLLCFVLVSILVSIFPSIKTHLLTIGIVIYIVFLLLTFIPQQLAKRNPDNKRVEKFLLGYGKVTGGLFSLYIFKKPINYMMGILTSNIQSKAFFVISIVLGFFMGIYASTQTEKYPSYEYMMADRYFTFNDKPYQFFPFNYKDHHSERTRIFTPMIQSDKVKDAYLSLFIPTIQREKEKIQIQELSLRLRIKTPRKEKNQITEKNLQHYVDFNQIYINEILTSDFETQYFTHPNAGEEGILMTIPTKSFQSGKNILQIRKNYFSDDDVQKIVTIPFYYEP